MEKNIHQNILSECCKKEIYTLKGTTGQGLFCSGCEKEIFSTIERDYFEFKKNTIEFCILNIEDLKEDGEANVWVFSDDSKANKEYFCKDLFNVVDAKELYRLLFNSESVKMSKYNFDKFFTEVLD